MQGKLSSHETTGLLQQPQQQQHMVNGIMQGQVWLPAIPIMFANTPLPGGGGGGGQNQLLMHSSNGSGGHNGKFFGCFFTDLLNVIACMHKLQAAVGDCERRLASLEGMRPTICLGNDST